MVRAPLPFLWLTSDPVVSTRWTGFGKFRLPLRGGPDQHFVIPITAVGNARNRLRTQHLTDARDQHIVG